MMKRMTHRVAPNHRNRGNNDETFTDPQPPPPSPPPKHPDLTVSLRQRLRAPPPNPPHHPPPPPPPTPPPPRRAGAGVFWGPRGRALAGPARRQHGQSDSRPTVTAARP